MYVMWLGLQKRKKGLGILVPFAFICLTVFISYPIFDASFVSKRTFGKMKQALVRVPDYWLDLENYSRDNYLENRIVTMPKNGYVHKSYIWPSGYVGFPHELFLEGNVIWNKEVAPYTLGEKLSRNLYDFAEAKDVVSFTNLARILNVGYILQMNDLDWLNMRLFDSWSVQEMEKFYEMLEPYFESRETFGELTRDYLLSIPHVYGGDNIVRHELEATTEDYLDNLAGRRALELYEIKSEFKLPKIFIPDHIILGDQLEVLLALMEDTKYLGETILFSSVPAPDNYSKPEVLYGQIRESRYRVYLLDTPKTMVPLVFSETYDPGWRVATECNDYYCSDYISPVHFQANNYANGWLISAEDIPDTNVLYIVHESEQRLFIGVIVSLATLSFISVTLTVVSRRGKKKYD